MRCKPAPTATERVCTLPVDLRRLSRDFSSRANLGRKWGHGAKNATAAIRPSREEPRKNPRLSSKAEVNGSLLANYQGVAFAYASATKVVERGHRSKVGMRPSTDKYARILSRQESMHLGKGSIVAVNPCE